MADIGPSLGHIGLNLAESGPKLVKLGPKLAEIRPISPDGPTPRQNLPTPTELAPQRTPAGRVGKRSPKVPGGSPNHLVGLGLTERAPMQKLFIASFWENTGTSDPQHHTRQRRVVRTQGIAAVETAESFVVLLRRAPKVSDKLLR